jgi:two-component system, response regulator FlrC
VTLPSPAADTAAEPAPIAESPAMRDLLRTLAEVAPTPTTVLLLGQAGSGRGRLGRFLHLHSGRAGPCLEVRCDAPAEEVIAALREAFAAAAGGTVILREVGALAPPAQSALVGALQERDPDASRGVRVVATAEPSLGARAVEGLYRSELYYRLNVFPAAVPGLRERPEDLAGLADSILREESAGAAPPSLDDGALEALRERAGSVGELVRLLRPACAPGAGTLTVRDLPGLPPAEARPAFPGELPLDLAQLERLAIEEALRRAGGNRTQAARLLNIGLRTLRNKLRAWREAGEEVLPSPRGRQEVPALRGPGAAETAAILARSWARRSQEGQV